MSVLVIGREEATGPVVAALRATGATAERADREAGIAALAAAPGAFALVLVAGQGGAFEDRRLYDAIAETGAVAPMFFLARPLAHAAAAAPAMCAIEQAPEGTRLLRCALAQARARHVEAGEAADALAAQPHVFAYCAPMRDKR